MTSREESYYKAKKEYNEKIIAFYNMMHPIDGEDIDSVCFNMLHRNWLGLFADVVKTTQVLGENQIGNSFCEIAWRKCAQEQIDDITEEVKESFSNALKNIREAVYQKTDFTNLESFYSPKDLQILESTEQYRKKYLSMAIEDFKGRINMFEELCDKMHGFSFFSDIKAKELKETLTSEYDRYKLDNRNIVERQLRDTIRRNSNNSYGVENIEWAMLYEREMLAMKEILSRKKICTNFIEELDYSEKDDDYTRILTLIDKAESKTEPFDMEYLLLQGVEDDIIDAFYDDAYTGKRSIDELVDFLFRRVVRLDIIREHIYPGLKSQKQENIHFPACIGYDKGTTLYHNLRLGGFIPKNTKANDFLYLMGCTNEKPKELQPIMWTVEEAPKQILREFVMALFKNEIENRSVTKAELERIVPHVFVDKNCSPIRLAKNKEVFSNTLDLLLSYLE